MGSNHWTLYSLQLLRSNEYINRRAIFIPNNKVHNVLHSIEIMTLTQHLIKISFAILMCALLFLAFLEIFTVGYNITC